MNWRFQKKNDNTSAYLKRRMFRWETCSSSQSWREKAKEFITFIYEWATESRCSSVVVDVVGASFK